MYKGRFLGNPYRALWKFPTEHFEISPMEHFENLRAKKKVSAELFGRILPEPMRDSIWVTGNGIMDELKKSGRAVGKAALRTGVSKLGSIKDVGSAKVAARAVICPRIARSRRRLVQPLSRYRRL